MKRELTTVEDAIAHAENHGRDFSTDRAVKHGDPQNKTYWLLHENPMNKKILENQPATS